LKFQNTILKCSLFIFIVLVLFLGPFTSTAQNLQSLQDQKDFLDSQITETEKRIKENQSSRKLTLESLQNIEQQILNREAMLDNMQQSLKIQSRKIDSINFEITNLEISIDSIKTAFGALLRTNLRRNLLSKSSYYILSSTNMNEAFQRWRYIKQIEQHQFRQLKKMEVIQMNLDQTISTMENEMSYQSQLLEDEKNYQVAFEREKVLKQILIEDIKKRGNSLKKELQQQQSEQKEMKKSILSLLEKAKKKASKASVIPEVKLALDKEFKKNKGRFPWPTPSKRITSQFGKQTHAVFKNISVSNNGIDIEIAGSTKIAAIAEGVVIGTQEVPGYKKLIIVQHGAFYSVYSNIDQVQVAISDKVNVGQVIGLINASNEPSSFHFEIWENKTPLNPIKWLSKK